MGSRFAPPFFMDGSQGKIGHCYYCHHESVRLQTEGKVDYYGRHSKPGTRAECPATDAPFVYPLGYAIEG